MPAGHILSVMDINRCSNIKHVKGKADGEQGVKGEFPLARHQGEALTLA